MQTPDPYHTRSLAGPYIYSRHGPESVRAIILGVLSIFFGYVYLVLWPFIINIPLRLCGDKGLCVPGTFLLMIGAIWTAIGLLVGGILLLCRRRAARGFIGSAFYSQLAGWVVVLAPPLLLFLDGGHEAAGQVLLLYGELAFIFLFYPMIGMLIASHSYGYLGID